MPHESRHTVKLEMHLPAGYSKVHLELGGGVGLAGGEIYWDIPTQCIPPHLRRIGSRFEVISTGLAGPLEVAQMTPEQIRASLGVRVIELPKEDG
jgi:hypothetical protein